MPKYNYYSRNSYRQGGGGSGGGRYSKNAGVYTSSGTRVRNVQAYSSTGAPTYTRAGKAIGNPVAYAGAIEGRMRQNTSTPKYLYHYTDRQSAANIAKTKTIRPSKVPGDCALGKGAYFTSLPPTKTTNEILSNNYGGRPHCSGHQNDRVQASVRIQADAVVHSGGQGQRELGRNVFCVPGGVDLRKAGGGKVEHRKQHT